MSDKAQPQSSIISDQQPPIYRAIMLARSGTVFNVVRLSAQDDEQAKAHARMLVDGHAVELWDGLRFIDHFAPVA